MQTGKKSVKMSELQIGDRMQTGKKSVKMSELQIGGRVQTGRIKATKFPLATLSNLSYNDLFIISKHC